MPLGSHTYSFHNSERGWKIMPAASERRSLLTGIPHGEPSRREIGSETILARPEQGFSIEGPRPCALSLELPGADDRGRRTDEASATIVHSIQPLSGAGCLPRQDGCSFTKGEPDINTLCPQSTFQELPVMGKEYASLDRSWPPVLGSGERHVLEESFLNFSRVTERFS